MRAVHVGVGHDDNTTVTELADVEGAFFLAAAITVLEILLWLPNAGAYRGNHRLDLGVLQRLVETRLLNVDQLSADRQDGLVTAVPAPFTPGARRNPPKQVKDRLIPLAPGTNPHPPRRAAPGPTALRSYLS